MSYFKHHVFFCCNRITSYNVCYTKLLRQSAFAWLSPGAGLGLAIGGVLLLISQFLPRPVRIALAGLALMAGTVLVNITPFNPYSVAALTAWRQGHFLNFNGLTRLTASFWPFLSLPYLIRITSYNVCYTKLLRNTVNLRTVAIVGHGAAGKTSLVV